MTGNGIRKTGTNYLDSVWSMLKPNRDGKYVMNGHEIKNVDYVLKRLKSWGVSVLIRTVAG